MPAGAEKCEFNMFNCRGNMWSGVWMHEASLSRQTVKMSDRYDVSTVVHHQTHLTFIPGLYQSNQAKDLSNGQVDHGICTNTIMASMIHELDGQLLYTDCSFDPSRHSFNLPFL